MDKIYESKISLKWGMEAPGIDPGTSRMLSERSTIWATPPLLLWSTDLRKLSLELPPPQEVIAVGPPA